VIKLHKHLSVEASRRGSQTAANYGDLE